VILLPKILFVPGIDARDGNVTTSLMSKLDASSFCVPLEALLLRMLSRISGGSLIH